MDVAVLVTILDKIMLPRFSSLPVLLLVRWISVEYFFCIFDNFMNSPMAINTYDVCEECHCY